jgi:hypothetical protein
MMNRNLSRRLERLEEELAPVEVRRIWQIVYVDSDGNRTEGEIIEWPAKRSAGELAHSPPDLTSSVH